MILIIVLALAFDLLNGIHDSSNIVATMISSRAIPPKVALAITAVAEFSGPFIFGVAVAKTIGDEIVKSGSISIGMIIAALSGAIIWNLLTWWLGMPSSSSHALIGGICGAVFAELVGRRLRLSGFEKVLIALFTSPLIGFIVGWLVIKIVYPALLECFPKN